MLAKRPYQCVFQGSGSLSRSRDVKNKRSGSRRKTKRLSVRTCIANVFARGRLAIVLVRYTFLSSCTKSLAWCICAFASGARCTSPATGASTSTPRTCSRKRRLVPSPALQRLHIPADDMLGFYDQPSTAAILGLLFRLFCQIIYRTYSSPTRIRCRPGVPLVCRPPGWEKTTP